jgi:CubicO group peptidase (beta-lactamase class C family)
MLFRFLLAAVILIGPCLAEDAARMDQVVQSHVADHSFMGSVLVARGNEIIFSKGYGSADLEWDVPNSPNTKFRLGSVTKQFTAASILMLEERGKLSVNDPVKKYIPDAPAAWDKITIMNLLTHTSGIPNFTGFPDYPKLEPFTTTTAQLVARFRDKPLEFAPGEKWNYSNSGYVLLTYLLEKISGGTYEAFVRENIFTPLGMKDSGVDSNAEVIHHRASGYVFQKGHFENAGFINMTVPQGAGALYSTTEDLLKWEQGLYGGKLLKAASLEKMTTPFKNDYAFGLMVTTTGGHKRIEHGGGIEGFNTDLAYYPDDKLTVVVLSNVNGNAPGEIAGKLAALARGDAIKLPNERKETTLDPKTLNRYVGAYQMMNGPAMLITLENNQLFSRLGNQPSVQIFPESETLFFLKVVDAQLEFSADANQMTLHQGGRDMVAKRLDDAAAKRLADANAANAQRFKDQKAYPEGEAVVRRIIEELRAGKPNYDLMNSGIASVTRQQLPQLQSGIVELGALQSVTFKGVGPGGADIYECKFENGSMEYRISLSSDGKLESAGIRRI